MKKSWEKIKENRNISIGIAVLVVLLVLSVSFSNSSFNILDSMVGADNQSANVAGSEVTSNLEESLEKEAKEDEVSVTADPNGTMINGLYYYNRVSVPLLASPELFDYDGIKTVGCGDELVWVKVDVDSTRAPLNSAIDVLMSKDRDFGFEPGNLLAQQENLSFDRAVIENAVAKIYLEGEFDLGSEACDVPREYTQLREVALQFDTVSDVELYLNGELLK